MSLIDTKIIKQLSTDVGEDMLGDLISIFISDTEERMKAMKLQLEERDLANLAITAHTLKSVCAQYGATVTSARAKELELLCHDKSAEDSLDKITSGVEGLCSDLNLVIKELSTLNLV